MEKHYIAYYRVSTVRQGQSGLGLEAQQHSVGGFVAGSGELLNEFVEIESGNRNDRPELLAALAACRQHGATLIIAKLDRLARNVAFVSNLMESGVEFVAVDNPHASKLTIHILCAVAEHEREMISERTKAALKAAKARGVRLGSPGGHPESLKRARNSLINQADERARKVRLIIADIQRSGLRSYRELASALNARGIRSARGGSWHPSSVRKALLRELNLAN